MGKKWPSNKQDAQERREEQIERQSQTPAGKEVTAAESDAEARYLQALAAAEKAAEALANDPGRDPSEKAAAEQAAKALREIESARVLAACEQPEQVPKTFAKAMRDWLMGVP